MNLKPFSDLSRCFSVVLFVQPGDIEGLKREMERLGGQRNVNLIVQPCPYEGIEFLCQVSGDLVGHQVSMEKELFWHTVELKEDTPRHILSELSGHHHAYLCAILEQKPKLVQREKQALGRYSKYFC